MARKITTDAINAFMSTKPFCRDNTSVVVLENFIYLQLHSNTIATRAVGSNSIQVTNAGWFTATTKERLNGLPGVSVNQRKGVWYLNGEEWDGKAASV